MTTACMPDPAIHRVRIFRTLNLQEVKEAFTSFLVKLRFSRKEEMHSLISCNKYEKE